MFAKLAGMRTLGEDDSRLQALSLPEVVERVRDVVNRLKAKPAESGFRFRSRKPRETHVINAAVLHFLGLAEEEQDRIFLASAEKLTSLMGLDEKADDELAGRIIAGSRPDAGDMDRPNPPVKPKLKRKGAG